MIKSDLNHWYELRDPRLLFKWNPLVLDLEEELPGDSFLAEQKAMCEKYNRKIYKACEKLAQEAGFCMYEIKRVVDNDDVPF